MWSFVAKLITDCGLFAADRGQKLPKDSQKIYNGTSCSGVLLIGNLARRKSPNQCLPLKLTVNL